MYKRNLLVDKGTKAESRKRGFVEGELKESFTEVVVVYRGGRGVEIQRRYNFMISSEKFKGNRKSYFKVGTSPETLTTVRIFLDPNL